MAVAQLVEAYPLISDQITKPALRVVLQQLEAVLVAGTPGAVVEFGCYVGTTSLFTRRLLDEQGASDQREFHVYDSFEGLPPKNIYDASAAGTQFKAGELKTSKKEFLKTFQKAGLQPPVTHKAWFEELPEEAVPEPIAFAFLDGDFYGSILTSLRLCWPRLSPGGVIAIDDYQRETLPGVERAVRDFFQGKDIQAHHEHNIAIVPKKP